jgi:hypothetical protein
LREIFRSADVDDVAADVSRDPDFIHFDFPVGVDGDIGDFGKITEMAVMKAEVCVLGWYAFSSGRSSLSFSACRVVSKEIIIAPEISNQSNGETTEIRNKTPAWEQKPRVFGNCCGETRISSVKPLLIVA